MSFLNLVIFKIIKKNLYEVLTYSTIYDTIITERRKKHVPNIEKIISKMKNQPHGIRLEEVEKVLKYYGYELDRQRGSHKQYLNKKTGDLITIKKENPLKKVYVVDVLNRIGE